MAHLLKHGAPALCARLDAQAPQGHPLTAADQTADAAPARAAQLRPLLALQPYLPRHPRMVAAGAGGADCRRPPPCWRCRSRCGA